MLSNISRKKQRFSQGNSSKQAKRKEERIRRFLEMLVLQPLHEFISAIVKGTGGSSMHRVNGAHKSNAGGPTSPLVVVITA